MFEGRRGWYVFAACLLFLTGVRILLAAVDLPPAFSFVSAAIFILVPFGALFFAASQEWKAAHGWTLLGVGAAIHIGLALAMRSLDGPVGWTPVIMEAVAQLGLMIWATGLGSLVGLILKDKNLILPVAVFVIGFDMFLIFSPISFTSKAVEQRSEVFQTVAMSVPSAQQASESPDAPRQPQVQPLVFVGPADLIFVMAFFVSLFRFNMRIKQTALWLLPVLAFYLLAVLLWAIALPALVPIGLTVMLVNRREFELNSEEKKGLLAVTIISIAIGGFGLFQKLTAEPKEEPAELSTQEGGPAAPRFQGSPAPASQD